MQTLNLEQLVRRMTNRALLTQLALLRFGLLLRHSARTLGPLHSLSPMIKMAREQRCEFFFDLHGREVGFLSWERLPSARRPMVRQMPAVKLTKYEADPAYSRAIHVQLASGAAIPNTVVHICRSSEPPRRERVLRQRARAAAVSQLSAPQEILDMRAADFASVLTQAECCLILNRSPIHKSMSTRDYLAKLRDLIGTEQLKIYRDPHGVAGGVLTWAWLGPEAAARLKERSLPSLHFSEWREGSQLCLCDAVASLPCLAQLQRDVLTDLFPDQRFVLLYRHSSSGKGGELLSLDRAHPGQVTRSWIQVCEA